MESITIGENEGNQRLDKFLKKYYKQAPLSSIYKIIRKDLKVNGKRKTESYILQKDDVLTLYVAESLDKTYKKEKRITKSKKQFKVIYEDENILVVDKPTGLLVHGDSREKKNTLLNQVQGYLYEKNEYDPRKESTFTPSSVNRLDRNTSGLVIFGKNLQSVQCLNEMMRERDSIRKLYMTCVLGTVKKEKRLVGDMEKDEQTGKVHIVPRGSGKSMETIIRPVTQSGPYARIEVEILTGRTHQIRVQLAHEGIYIIGDPKYGKIKENAYFRSKYGIDNQLLHSYKLIFGACKSPLSYLEGKVIETELPPLFVEVCKELKL